MEPDNHGVEPLDFGFAVSVIPIVLTDSLEAPTALHDLYHGARANKLLFNIRKGSITADSSEKIYFAEREWQNCFVHGADLETGESYVAKFRVDVPSAARFIPDPRPGNADARVVAITPGSSIPAKLARGNG